MKKLLYIKVLALMIFALNLNAQHHWCGFEGIPLDADTTRGTRKSSNGYWLPVSGELRVLVVFLEMVYADPNLDPSPNGTNEWPAGQLPVWADELFDHATPTGVSQGAVTRYFQDASSGNKILLGDYLVSPDNGGVFQVHTVDGKAPNPSYLIPAINAMLGNTIITSKGYNSIADFDKWTPASQGLPKDPTGNNRWDNVVFIVRNSLLPGHKTGRAGASMSNLLLGYQGDSWSIQCTHDIIPTLIVRHEYAHFLLGDNDFHAGGGGWGQPFDYWIPQIGDWSMLGGNSCSFLSWNAWDRQRMGWSAPGNQFNPSARNSTNTIEVNGDLDATNPNDAGIYTLRDFVTTGDAIRIKLPFIDASNEYQQWIWVENRQGIVFNNNPFDQWQYQSSHPHCVVGSQPGLGIYIQIDKDIRESNSASLVYGGYAGYIRPLPANGLWDRNFPTQTVFNDCVSGGNERTFQRLFENPFTGGGDQEAYTWDIDENGIINHDDQLANYVEDVNGQYVKNLFYLGHGEHIFTLNGNNKLNISGNPSSVPLMNMVSYNNSPPTRPNVRKIYLNGVSVEMLHQDQNGNVQVQIRFDDVDITNDVRWCADEIVLNPIPTQSDYSLNLKSGNTITLDQGLTATRMNNPITFDGKQVFASPTVLRIKKNAFVNQEEDSYFIVKNGSKLKLETGSKLIVNHNAELIIKEGSHLFVDDCASLIFLGDAKLIVENGATLELAPNALIFYANGEQNLEIDPGAIIAPGTLHPEVFAFPSLTISTNVIVEDKVCYIPDLITIEDGASLTLINSTLRFDSSITRMIVESGAKLVVDNSTLTSACNGPWRGIEVWGNPNLSHIPPTNQGWVQVINGGIIENAVCGIRTSKTELQNGEFVDVYGFSGGIVQAHEAVFRNNRTAVKFLEYGFDKNLSYFQNCEFVTDNELPDGTSPDYFIKLEGIRGIGITECTFSNTTAGDANDPQRGSGIFAVNSDILVSAKCKYPDPLPVGEPCPEGYLYPSEFNGLYYGVYGLGTGQNRKVKVDQNVFNNNFRGLFISALHNSTVTRNTFDVYREQPVQNPESFGFRIEDADGYQIEENHFTGFDDNGVRYGVGLLIENSGSNPNMVYNNLFENLHLATLAVGMNRNQYNNEGLCYKCNDFVNNSFDIRVSGQRTEGIALHQGANLPGNNKAPAGNVFSSAPVNSNFFNGTVNEITYHRHEGPIEIKLSPNPYHGPLDVLPVQSTIYSKAESCPSNLDGSGSPIEEQKMMEAGQQADSTYTELALLVDEGDTDAMNMEVQSTTQVTANDTYDQLVQTSPYLSDTVLKTTIAKEDVLTNAMIRDVMLANPQSAKSEVILDMLEAKSDPMPEGMMADIYDGKLILGGREMLEAEAAHYSRERYRAFSNLFRLYYADTLDLDAYDNLLALLAAEAEPTARYKLAFLHLDNNEPALAGQTLANIPLAFNLDDNALDIHQAYLDLTDIWLQIMNNPVYFSAPDTGIINDLMALYNAGFGLPSVFARNILLASGLVEYEPFVTLTEPLKRDRFYRRDAFVQEEANLYLKLYPNPTSGSLTLEYKVDEGTKYAGIVFTDIQGVSQRSESLSLSGGVKHLSVKDLKPGVYMVRLFLDNKQVAVQRLTIAY